MATADCTFISQSAFAQSLAATGLDLAFEIIAITRGSIGIAEYQGTRAALVAEGVIPADIKLPEGFGDLHWEDDKFRYWLSRRRPEGLKGPRKQFFDLDWWMFRFYPLNAKPDHVRHVELKAKELADLIYRQSAQGHAESSKLWDDYWKAQKDEKYQAFKAIIPGINRPARGRRPKTLER